MAQIKLARLQELRSLKARQEDLRRAEYRRKRDENRARWPSPLDMGADLDPPRLDDNGDRIGVWRTPALDLINEALVDLAEGRESRLAAMLSPQEGKSTLVSFWFVLWLLACVSADLRVLILSYSDEMARRWGGEIKDALERWSGDEGTVDLGLRLRKDSRAAGRWNIAGHKGSVYCAGVAGSITGKPCDVGLVDDPLKNMEEAQSEKYRDRATSVYRAVLVPRMGPGAKLAWIQTCWHEQEPIQQILANEGDKADGGKWRVIRIPAIAEDDAQDPLGRRPGEGMVSARGHRDWGQIRKDVGEYVFSALYQQRAAPAQGNVFKRLWWRYWNLLPGFGGGTSERLDLAGRIFNLSDCWRFATVDLANSTRTSADWTVISAWARTIDGDLVLLDRTRARIGEGEHFTHARPLVERWRLDTLFVEASQYGTSLVREATQAGVPISPVAAETDKLTRALPASARCSNGRVWLPTGAWWLKTWTDEAAAFPNGTHDDQVDTLAYAVRVAITQWAPPPAKPPAPASPSPLDAAFGDGKQVDDWFKVAM